MELDRGRIGRDKMVKASVMVTNSGKRAGWETVQLYIRDLAGNVIRPVRERYKKEERQVKVYGRQPK